MIKAMAIQEIRSRYAGTMGGFVWAILNPLMMILVFWFVFSLGFKVQPAGGVPFVIVFSCGLIPWMTFSEILMADTNAITGNTHLVTKAIFPTEILPVVNLVASLITHSIMLIILMVLILVYNVPFSLYNFQVLYYLGALSVFSLGLGWFLSAVNVFYRDMGQILGVILNMWFWITPIVWQIEMIPQKYQFIVMLNPMYYIVDGYKSSFVYHVPFWHDYGLSIYLWIICVLSFIIGGLTFIKLKPEFAEVL